jgi:hypothetical protein
LEERQEATNAALADYTKWLMRYTGLLFAATLAMGIATIGLYFTGEKQIGVAKDSAEAAKLNAEALINAERAHLYAVIKTDNLRQALHAAKHYENSPSMDDSPAQHRKWNSPSKISAVRPPSSTT